MKKYWWIIVLVAVVGFTAFYFVNQEPKDYAVGSEEWSYYTVENEAKRPASFDQMKATPDVEMRGPASEEK